MLVASVTTSVQASGLVGPFGPVRLIGSSPDTPARASGRTEPWHQSSRRRACGRTRGSGRARPGRGRAARPRRSAGRPRSPRRRPAPRARSRRGSGARGAARSTVGAVVGRDVVVDEQLAELHADADVRERPERENAARRPDETLDLGIGGLDLRDDAADRLVDERKPDLVVLAHGSGRIRAAPARHASRRHAEQEDGEEAPEHVLRQRGGDLDADEGLSRSRRGRAGARCASGRCRSAPAARYRLRRSAGSRAATSPRPRSGRARVRPASARTGSRRRRRRSPR